MAPLGGDSGAVTCGTRLSGRESRCFRRSSPRFGTMLPLPASGTCFRQGLEVGRVCLSDERLFFFRAYEFFGGITPAFLRMTLSAWRLNFAPRSMGSSVTSFGGIFTMPSASRSFLPGSPNFSTNVS